MIPRLRQRCGNCDAFVPAGPNGIGNCVARPPTAFQMQMMVPNPNRLIQQGAPDVIPAMQIQGVFPPTHEARWCRDWQTAEVSSDRPTIDISGLIPHPDSGTA